MEGCELDLENATCLAAERERDDGGGNQGRAEIFTAEGLARLGDSPVGNVLSSPQVSVTSLSVILDEFTHRYANPKTTAHARKMLSQLFRHSERSGWLSTRNIHDPRADRQSVSPRIVLTDQTLLLSERVLDRELLC